MLLRLWAQTFRDLIMAVVVVDAVLAAGEGEEGVAIQVLLGVAECYF